MSMTRRGALETLAGVAGAAGAAIVAASGGSAGEALAETPAPSSPPSPPAAPAKVVPLPFDPKTLRGISEKLIVSHWENNYSGAVKNLAKVREAIAQTGRDSAPFLVAGLRERELTFRNSAVLHEHYFANLGGDGKVAGAAAKAAAESFGGLARFEELLRATAMGIAGGSGWALLAYDLQNGGLEISWSGNHTQVPAFSRPLLVLDMYEHAFQMDYGAAAAKYVDAFFANVKWDEVDRRYEGALRAAKALRG